MAIEVEGLTKSFGSRLALRGIDLKVKPGETVALLGPNGAGKTTLLKVLAGIMSPSAGRVVITGRSLKDDAEAVRRHIGIVTHQTFLYGDLTGCENLEFYARMYDLSDRGRRIEQVMAMVGMTSRRHDRVGTLSRGMQQRLSIARCLLHEPSIVLLDEPETGLDQKASAMLWGILRSGEKRTVVLTTHSLEWGLELCGRVLILARGKIAYEGVSGALDIGGLKAAYHGCTEVGP